MDKDEAQAASGDGGQQQKKKADVLGNIEDCMTKLIRLVANLSTDEENANEILHLCREEVEEVFRQSV